MKHFWVIIFFFIATIGNSQELLRAPIPEKPKEEYSVDMIAGVTQDCNGLTFKYFCEPDEKIRLFKKQLLTLTGQKTCSNGKKYYEVYFKGTQCFVNSDYMLVLDETLEKLNNIDTTSQRLIRLRAEDSSIEWYNLEVDKANALFKKCQASGIAIIDSEVYDESEYTSGTGYKINFFNTSAKTIKYISFTLTGYNAVDDVVSTKTVKGIGPIAKDQNGEYNFNYVWHTDIVQTVKISSIKIQYMNGTFKTIAKPKESMLSEWCAYMVYQDNPYYVDTNSFLLDD